ncbi:MAG: class II fructose-bisphosphate aldolase [Lachnospiraceae bacterium]|nr:class II fructose-bisphosphate aldolase [Lachnospiraceae bacterium]
MALEKTSDIIKSAQEHNTAVYSVNCFDYNTILGVIRAAEETATPVLVQLLPDHDTVNHTCSIEGFAAITKELAAKVKVPIGLHLDHCYTIEEIRRAADAGFLSVMYDGSAYSFDENAARTKEIVDEMRARGVWVEGEIGHVGLAAEDSGSDEDLYTQPDMAQRYVAESGVDMLAIAIGNAHGFYKGTPHLDIERLDQIRTATNGLPLVLHGGSGIPDEQLQVAFSRGINKFNFGTNYLWTYYKAIASFVKAHESEAYADVITMSIPAQDELCAYMKDRYKLCLF